MARKIMDLAVCVGQYTDRRTGREKGRWQNIGSLMRNNNGSQFLLLDRTFNPAGVPNPDNQQSVLINLFEPRIDSQERQPKAQSKQETQPPENPVAADLDDEIPF